MPFLFWQTWCRCNTDGKMFIVQTWFEITRYLFNLNRKYTSNHHFFFKLIQVSLPCCIAYRLQWYMLICDSRRSFSCLKSPVFCWRCWSLEPSTLPGEIIHKIPKPRFFPEIFAGDSLTFSPPFEVTSARQKHAQTLRNKFAPIALS